MLIFALVVMLVAFVWLAFFDSNLSSDTINGAEYAAFGIMAFAFVLALVAAWRGRRK